MKRMLLRCFPVLAVIPFAWMLTSGTTVAATPQTTNNMEGKALFEHRCAGCHALDRDKEGPRLGTVYGRKAGSVSTFSYSAALKNAQFVWDEATLDKWLQNTSSVVPNNNMDFRVVKPEERAAIIGFLKSSAGR